MEELKPRGGTEPAASATREPPVGAPPEKPVIVYANKDKDKIVTEDSGEAAYIVNVENPGEFAELLPAGKAAARQEERQAERQAEPAPEAKAGRRAEDK
jgi:hypothetical protein